MYIIHIDFYFRGDLSKLTYAILVAVKFVKDCIVKVSNVKLGIDCEVVNVIVVPDTEATKQVPDIPVPVTTIPTMILEFDVDITTVVDEVVALVEVEVVIEVELRIINDPAV